MMYEQASDPCHDEELVDDYGDYYEPEDSGHYNSHGHRWVRPGYIPPGEAYSNKTELQLVQEDIQRLKDEIERKESRLKLAKLQEEIKQIGSKLREKEELARNRQASAQQAQIHERLSKKHEKERKTKIQTTFKQVFNVQDTEPTALATQEDIQRILNSKSDYDCFQVTQTTMLSTIKKKYKELARMIHPDKCKLKGAKEAFVKIGEAYARLTELYPTDDSR